MLFVGLGGVGGRVVLYSMLGVLAILGVSVLIDMFAAFCFVGEMLSNVLRKNNTVSSTKIVWLVSVAHL